MVESNTSIAHAFLLAGVVAVVLRYVFDVGTRETYEQNVRFEAGGGWPRASAPAVYLNDMQSLRNYALYTEGPPASSKFSHGEMRF